WRSARIVVLALTCRFCRSLEPRKTAGAREACGLFLAGYVWLAADGDHGVITETALRFVLGGIVVSLFAVVGTIVKPPTFAGVFASAPSVAIATLTLAFAKESPVYVATEARSMIIGAVGLVTYSAACAWAVARPRVPVWRSATLCWTIWLAATFLL